MAFETADIAMELHSMRSDGSELSAKVDDDKDNQDMGHTQELFRQFKTKSLVGFTVTLGATWPYAIVSSPLSLANGGPAGAIWMFLVTCVGFGCVVTSLAHAASMQPYSGGPYHWVSVFAREPHQRLLSYIVGWFEVLGWIASTAGTVYFVTQILLGTVVLFHPVYTIQDWHIIVCCVVLTAISVLANYGIHAFRMLEGVMLVLSVAGFVVFTVVLLALGPRRHVHDTFFDFQDTQGWGSKGLAALVGILGPVVTLIGADSTSHLAEETRGARKIVPRAMFISIAVSYTFGFVMNVVVMVVSDGYSEELAAKTGNAGIAIIYNATQSYAATKVMCIALFLMLFWGLNNQLLAASRVTWAFARDGGLPGYSWLTKVDSHNVPKRAILVVFLGTCALVLFPLASTIALNIITSCALAALSMAYLICICVLVDARAPSRSVDDIKMDDRHFPLPMWFVWVAEVIAIAFLILITIMLAFPAAPQPDAESMNWTCVILPGMVAFALTWYYFLGGKKNYIGPGEKFSAVQE